MPKIDQKKKNIILISLMVAAVGLTMYVLLKNDSGDSVKTVEDSIYQPGTATPVPANLDESIFESDEFKKLEDFSKQNLDTSKKGRVNPFEPFQLSIEQ